MALENLTDYERRRLENIRRNDEMLAALNIHSKASELSSAAKRQRTKSYIVSEEKKPGTQTPIVTRRSLRTRGMPPHYSNANGVKNEFFNPVTKTAKPSPHDLGPLCMRDVYRGVASDRTFIKTIMGVSKKSQLNSLDEGTNDLQLNGLMEEFDVKYEAYSCAVEGEDNGVVGSVDLESLTLKKENIARVMPGRIYNVRFFPTTNVNMIVAGNKFGYVAFWDMNSRKGEGDGIYLYHPHSGPVLGISVQPFSFSKIFTSCYDGFIRLMDAEKEVFDLVYSSDEAIFSLVQRPNDVNCLYFSEGHGRLNIWDVRAGKSATLWILHADSINSIDFNSENPNIMATSSTDGTACIWDLRSIDADKPKTLKMVGHTKAVHSAYFSPSGSCLAMTGNDNMVGILSGVNFEEVSMIHHNNQTCRWRFSFGGIWGWDDSHIFIGNMERGVDVLSPARRKTIMTLQSKHITAIPCRFDAHPCKVGMLAGATRLGQVYVWTS